MANPVINVENVTKSFGSFLAVKAISFSVAESTCFGLLGPNGAGKTTVQRMLYGLCNRDKKPQGTISVFGNDPQINPLAIKFISGIVPQNNNLDEELNVEQNLRVFCRFYNIPKKQAIERIAELLEFMDLADKQKAKVRELSGGMQRRLVIARALLNNPRLLILDEPTTGLDPQVRHVIWDKLRSLRSNGMTIMLTTHYMEEAFQICDTVMIMNKGERVIEGNPHTLVDNHIEPFVMELYDRETLSLLTDKIPSSCTRVDDSAGIIRIYSCDEPALRKLTANLKPGTCFVRPSNLEDLFLKTTGSTLNEQQ
jgi:lipooligosaccharide transport system ATP-binding protein